MDNTTYYQRNREIMLNRARGYYENDKERLREQARNKYWNLSEEDKNKKKRIWKKRKNLKNIKNADIEKQKSLRIMNKIVYFTIKSIYLEKLREIKA